MRGSFVPFCFLLRFLLATSLVTEPLFGRAKSTTTLPSCTPLAQARVLDIGLQLATTSTARRGSVGRRSGCSPGLTHAVFCFCFFFLFNQNCFMHVAETPFLNCTFRSTETSTACCCGPGFFGSSKSNWKTGAASGCQPAACSNNKQRERGRNKRASSEVTSQDWLRRQHQAAGDPAEVNHSLQVTLLSCLFGVTVQANTH